MRKEIEAISVLRIRFTFSPGLIYFVIGTTWWLIYIDMKTFLIYYN